jgi:hypothetical protein
VVVVIGLIFFLMIIVSLRFLKTCVVREWKPDHYLFCTTYKIKATFYLQSLCNLAAQTGYQIYHNYIREHQGLENKIKHLVGLAVKVLLLNPFTTCHNFIYCLSKDKILLSVTASIMSMLSGIFSVCTNITLLHSNTYTVGVSMLSEQYSIS